MFDFIIVGAGSAGCVLAERLSACGRYRVALIEEGPARENWLSRMPKGFGKLLTDPSRVHHIPTSFARDGSNQPEVWIRGKMVGGSSSVNGMVWNKGVPADYDRLAQLAGPQWAWSSMLPYLRGIEDHAMGADAVRGAGGDIAVTTHPEPNPLIDALVTAGTQMGLPIKVHHGQIAQEGIGYLQWNIDRRGRRVSAARGFVDRARRRSNLTIISNVRIDRVGIAEGRASAVIGVRDGQPVRFEANGEIVLSAGAIGSPRILQQSGIGPADTLRLAGIPVSIDHAGIGRNMREHWLLMQHFRLRDGQYSTNAAFGGARLALNLVRYALFGRGPMATGSSEAAAFVQVLPESDRTDTQIMFAPYSLDLARGTALETEPGIQLYAFALRPRSLGSIAVTSPDPAAPLRIDPNYHTDDYDRRASVAAVRYIRRLIAQPPLLPFITGETALTAQAQSDAEILGAFRRYGQAGYHAVGTVAMGLHDTPLDGRLRVRGIQGLRVVDCSVFPEMITGNTNAPTMAMAARAADLVLEDAT